MAFETKTRTLVRSVIWRIFGVILTGILTIAFGGSVKLAVELGITYNAIRLVTHYFHDRAWSHLQWGLLHPGAVKNSSIVAKEVSVQCDGIGFYFGRSEDTAWQQLERHKEFGCNLPHSVIARTGYQTTTEDSK